MSTPNSYTPDDVRQMLADRLKADPDFTLSGLERLLGGSPTRQALQKFKEGEGGASFWERVGRVLRGEPDVPGLVEEAESALRLVREAEAAMLRVTERLRLLPIDPDMSRTIKAADKPMQTAPQDVRPVKRKQGGTGK